MAQDLNDILRRDGPGATRAKFDAAFVAGHKANGNSHQGCVLSTADRRLKANRMERKPGKHDAQAETSKSPHVNVYDFPDDDSFSIRLADSVTGSGARGRAKEQPTLITPTAFKWRNPATLPKRQFIYGTHYIRKFVSTTLAPGAAGKTSLGIVEALAA